MDGVAWASSAMSAARARLDVATDNLANASTDGFHRHVAHGTLRRSGVRINTSESAEQGALRHTGRPFDLALAGSGAFTLLGDHGAIVRSRAGAFTPDAKGILRDDAGRALLGERGPVRVDSNATVGRDGAVVCKGQVINRIALPAGTTLQSGFLETSNVNSISEMVDVLTAQRSFESAQKVLSAIDSTKQKASNELARLK